MKVKIIGKYSDKSVPQLKIIATQYFNKFIRLRDSDDGYGRCISSGQTLIVPSENAQAGHYYSGGNYPQLKFNEDNVHLQGKSDNYFKSGNLLEYRKNLIKKIGIERVEELDRIAEESKRQKFKWNRFYLIEVIETYKSKLKSL